MPESRLRRTRAVYVCPHDVCDYLTEQILKCTACGELVPTPDLRVVLDEARAQLFTKRAS